MMIRSVIVLYLQDGHFIVYDIESDGLIQKELCSFLSEQADIVMLL